MEIMIERKYPMSDEKSEEILNYIKGLEIHTNDCGCFVEIYVKCEKYTEDELKDFFDLGCCPLWFDEVVKTEYFDICSEFEHFLIKTKDGFKYGYYLS